MYRVRPRVDLPAMSVEADMEPISGRHGRDEGDGCAGIAAIIVCFHPDADKLAALIKTIAPAVELVIVFDNGGLDSSCLPVVGVRVRVESHKGANVGIGMALNLSSQIASQAGCRYAISFDQDSLPEPGMIDTLIAELHGAIARGLKVAAIGPQLVDVRDDQHRRSIFIRFVGHRGFDRGGEGTGEVSLLITSGCLYNLQAWEEIPFDDRLFIDHVDFNWCLRLLRQGFVLLGTTRARMCHELSAGLVKLNWITLTQYSPLRRYFQCRNAIYQILYEAMPPGARRFLLKNLVSTVMAAAWADEARWRSLGQCARGLMHGLFRHLGPFR